LHRLCGAGIYFGIDPEVGIASLEVRGQWWLAEKVGVVETAAEFFKKRAGRATGQGLMKFLCTAPKLAPEREDAVR